MDILPEILFPLSLFDQDKMIDELAKYMEGAHLHMKVSLGEQTKWDILWCLNYWCHL